MCKNPFNMPCELEELNGFTNSIVLTNIKISWQHLTGYFFVKASFSYVLQSFSYI